MNIKTQLTKMVNTYGERYGVISAEVLRGSKGSHSMVRLTAADGFTYDTPVPLNRDIIRVSYIFQEFARKHKSSKLLLTL